MRPEFAFQELRRVRSVPVWYHEHLPPLGCVIRVGVRIEPGCHRIEIASGVRSGEHLNLTAHYLRHYTSRDVCAVPEGLR